MIEIANQTKTKINSKKILAIGEAFVRFFKVKQIDISLAIVGDQRMRTLNNIYRGYDKTTDVLSFTDTWEIIINPQEIKRLSRYREILEFIGVSYPPKNIQRTQEYLLYFIFVHGLLHLIGYNDEKESERLEMLASGLNFLTKHGIIIK